MLAFTQTALFVSQSDADFNQRLDNLIGKEIVKRESMDVPEPDPEEAPSKHSPEDIAEPNDIADVSKTMGTMASILLELANLAGQIARVDQMLAQSVEAAPVADEAKHWHAVSLRALEWSRKTLLEKQARCLSNLSSINATSADSVLQNCDLPSSQPEMMGPPPGLEHLAPGLALPQQNTSPWVGWSSEDAEACPEFVPQSLGKPKVSRGEGKGALSQDLEALRAYNSERVLSVRKLKKLGFDSPAALKAHFSQYGEVADVRITHSQVAPTASRPNGRLRPAALGFVVMGCDASAQGALEAGQQQDVNGVAIEVYPFEPFEN